jgi:RNA polymerase sigma-70 factor (ECF subfamily)
MDSPVSLRLPNLGISEEHRRAPQSVPLETVSDETLMEEICRESREALAILFRRYARIVRGVAYRVLRDTSEADDLLQDIFLLVHRLCGTFDSSRGPARFWILQMTYRRAVSRRRYLTSRHFYTHADLDEVANQLGDTSAKAAHFDDLINENLDRHKVQQSWFTELSESQRQTLQLFFFEGCSFEDIAERMGQTVGNARNHYYRGLEKLRQQLSASKLLGKEAV